MQLLEPRTRRWTKTEYYQMGDLGWFRGQRVELIEGEIVVLSPQGFEHGASTDATGEALRNAFGTKAWVRTQLPIDLGEYSEPEADVSVVEGRRKDYKSHPKTALLVVEVSESSLA